MFESFFVKFLLDGENIFSKTFNNSELIFKNPWMILRVITTDDEAVLISAVDVFPLDCPPDFISMTMNRVAIKFRKTFLSLSMTIFFLLV